MSPRPSLPLADVAGAADIQAARALLLGYQASLGIGLAYTLPPAADDRAAACLTPLPGV